MMMMMMIQDEKEVSPMANTKQIIIQYVQNVWNYHSRIWSFQNLLCLFLSTQVDIFRIINLKTLPKDNGPHCFVPKQKITWDFLQFRLLFPKKTPATSPTIREKKHQKLIAGNNNLRYWDDVFLKIFQLFPPLFRGNIYIQVVVPPKKSSWLARFCPDATPIH